ncbi:MAG: PAS domain S-box protein [Bdellovibrionales bacterium]|nr:PAS domain S-box protein [Bdellovibrionales bacterium]
MRFLLFLLVLVLGLFLVNFHYSYEKKKLIHHWNDRILSEIQLTGSSIAKFSSKSLIDFKKLKSFCDHNSLNEIAEHFEGFLLHEIGFYQLRILDDRGQEVLRLEDQDSRIVRVPKKKLQYKGKRDYFQSLKNIQSSEVQISALNLNRENGQLEIPYRPTIRYMARLDRDDGKKLFFVANFDIRNSLKSVYLGKWPFDAKIMVAKDNGFWLISPEKDQEFGDEISDRKIFNLDSFFSDLEFDWKTRLATDQKILTLQDGQLLVDRLIAFDQNLYVMVYISADQIFSLTSDLFWGHVAVALFFGLFFAVFYFVVNFFIRRSNLHLQRIRELSSVVEQNPMAVLVTDTKSQILYVNSAAESLYGYSKKEVLGKTPKIWSSNVYNREFFQNMYQQVNDGFIWHGEILNRHKDGGNIWVELTIFAIKNEDNEIIKYVRIEHDITQKIESERESKNLQERLVQNSKMAAIGVLAGGMAHEINNPLAIIRLHMNRVKKNLFNPHKDESFFYNSFLAQEKAVNRIARIVNELLVFSEVGSSSELRVDNFKLENAILSATQMVDRTKSFGRIKFDISVLCEDCYAFGSQSKFEQALYNILTNAVDSLAGRDYPTIQVSLSVHHGIYRIKIKDNGVGIKEEHLLKIYDSFFTTKPEGKGMGLGLSYTYVIVQSMGGTVKVESKYGEGTICIVEIPMSESIKKAA